MDVQSFIQQYGFLVWIVILVGSFWLLFIRPQQQRARRHQELVKSLKSGDEVVTIGGMYGKIKSVSDEKVNLTIAKGVDVEMSKTAIARNLSKSKQE